MKGSKINIKLDLQVFMHKTFYLGIISTSSLIDWLNRKRTRKKICRQARSARSRAGPPDFGLIRPRRAGNWFEGLPGRARLPVGRRPEAVSIDEDRRIKWPSTVLGHRSPSAAGERAQTLAWPGSHGGSPRGPPRRRGPDGAERHTPASWTRGGMAGLDAGRHLAHPRWWDPIWCSRGVDKLVSLGQENSSVRSTGMLEVPVGRGGGRRVFRTMPFFPPSLQNTPRVSLLSLLVQSKGAVLGVSGELSGGAGLKWGIREWAGVVCTLIPGREWYRSVWGFVG
jgi:hypothetical protein